MIEEVEALGGMTKAIESGMPKLRIEESAARKQARIDTGQDIIVGVNKYRLAKEEPISVLQIDNSAVRGKQIERLTRVKAARDARRVDEALARLRHSAALSESTGKGSHPYNLLRLSVEAARALHARRDLRRAAQRVGRAQAHGRRCAGRVQQRVQERRR